MIILIMQNCWKNIKILAITNSSKNNKKEEKDRILTKKFYIKIPWTRDKQRKRKKKKKKIFVHIVVHPITLSTIDQ